MTCGPHLSCLRRRAALLVDTVHPPLFSGISSASCPARGHGSGPTLGRLQRRAALLVGTGQSLSSGVSSSEPPCSRTRGPPFSGPQRRAALLVATVRLSRASPAVRHSSVSILGRLQRRAVLYCGHSSVTVLWCFQRRAALFMDLVVPILQAFSASCPARGHSRFFVLGHLQSCPSRGHGPVFILGHLRRRAVLLVDTGHFSFSSVFSGELLCWWTCCPSSSRSSAASCPARGHNTLLILGHLQRRAALLMDAVLSSFSGISNADCPTRGHGFSSRSLASPAQAVLLMDLWSASFSSSAASCPAPGHSTPRSRTSSAAGFSARGRSSVFTFGHLQRRAVLLVDTVQSPPSASPEVSCLAHGFCGHHL